METYIDGIPATIDLPNICPHCHVRNHPTALWSRATIDINDSQIVLTAWECANKDCLKVFLAQYKVYTEHYRKETAFQRFLDGLPKGPDWPKPISDLLNGHPIDPEKPEPSKFIKTYLQSLEAEHHGLDEIAGMGYRKSIEYLVKDWAIQNHPDKKAEIIGSWLGKVITTYYTGDLKSILERATWLGNDESHYNKLFEEYSIEDLKKLISLIMVELDRQYQMAYYIETIQSKK